MIKAFVFDLGNTLVEIPRDYDEEIRLRQLLGFPSTEDVRSIIYSICHQYPGQSEESFLARMDSTLNPGGDVARSLAMREIWYQSVERAVLKDNALEILDRIKDHGFKLGLVSNTPPISHAIINRLRLRSKFDAVVFSCDVGYLKPDPRIFLKVLDKLGVAAQESVVIGDKIRTDILGGAILGMRAVLLENRMRCSVENGQNYVDAIICRLSDFFKTNIWQESCDQR